MRAVAGGLLNLHLVDGVYSETLRCPAHLMTETGGSTSSRQAVRRTDAFDGPHVENGQSCFRIATEYVSGPLEESGAGGTASQLGTGWI